MKRLIVALVASFAITCYGQTSYLNLLSPSPIGIALSAGAWIYDNASKDRVYFIKVKGVGANQKEAREDGFKVAIDNAVGSMLLSESTISDGAVIKKEIIQYSSGYVQRYEVTGKQQVGNDVVVYMDVYVSHSKIAKRLTNNNKVASRIDSQQLDASVSTLQRQTKDGDRVILAILNDYPEKAFTIENKQLSLVRNSDRSISLHVPYKMKWSTSYVEALGEAIVKTKEEVDYHNRQSAFRIVARAEGVLFLDRSWESWTFDRKRYDLFLDAFYKRVPMVRVVVHNNQNRIVYDQCFETDSGFTEVLDNRVVIEGSHTPNNQKAIINNINENTLSDLQKVSLSIVRSSECRI